MNFAQLLRQSTFVAYSLICVSQPAHTQDIGCSASAQLAFLGCGYATKDDFFVSRAKCLDTAGADVDGCFAAAKTVLGEDDEECGGVFAARLELCEALNDAAHEPAFGEAFAANFVNPLEIGISIETNPYLPLAQGNRWVYEAILEDDGEVVTETITVNVRNETKLIAGVTCLVVQDVVEVDGELVEDTDDWFAQDIDGNVWYCGEEAKDFEVFEDDLPPTAELVSNDGSFKAGRDGDMAGLLLPAAPVVGDLFRQELSLDNAEDVIEIIAVDGTETAPAAACSDSCLVTRDFSPLDPGVEENKYYAPGVGLIVEIDIETGDRAELIDFVVN